MNNKVLEQLKEEYNETLNRMQDLGDILAHCAEMDTSHCGQDADMDDACCQARREQQEGFSYKDLLGMEVIGIGGIASSCEHCSEADCVKVELVGGTYMCLAKPQQEEPKRPVISFDEEGHKTFTHHGNCDVSRRINEKNFSTYQEALDDAVHDVKAHGATHFSCPLAVLVAQREIDVKANPMQEIKQKADDFMDYLYTVIKTDRNE